MLALLTLFACGQSNSPAEPAPSEPAPDDPHARLDPHADLDPHANLDARAKAGDKAIVRRGKVVEVVPASSYTYARLDYCGQEAWVAGPKSDLVVGRVVKMPEGSVQSNFASPTLGRTLDTILFVDWFEMTDEESIDCSHMAAKPSGTTVEDEPQIHGKVVETMASGGYTYALVDTCGTQQWMAGQQSVLKVGHFVTAKEGMVMKNFPARSLDRTFDSLTLVNHFTVVPEGPECE